MTTPEQARELLDDVAADLAARGLPEGLAFAVSGRRTSGMRSSALHVIGFEDGRFLAWYRESAERDVYAESEDLDEVRTEFVRRVVDDARAFREHSTTKP